MSDQEQPPYLDMPCPPKMREWADDVYEWMLLNRLTAGGPGIFVEDAAGGGKRVSATGVAGAIGAIVLPFTVFFRSKVTPPLLPQHQRIIYKESPVQQSEDHTDVIYAEGIADNDDPLKASNNLWKNTAEGDLIWGEIEFDPKANPDAPFTVKTHKIKSTSAGDTFNPGGEAEYVDIGDPAAMPPTHIYAQSILRYPIALISIPTGKSPFCKIIYARNTIRLVSSLFTAILADGSTPRDINGVFYWV